MYNKIKNNSMSVIIRVKDDLRVKNCVESIDEDVEIIIVLNTPTPQVREIIRNLKVKTVEIDTNNLAKAHNAGINVAKNERILLMDSDCTFSSETIKKLNNALDYSDISKGKVIFNYKTFIGKIVAKSREYHVTDIKNAYAPPLAFKKSIINKIGDYYFAEDLFWTEDHEFDQRIKRARIPIKHINSATIHHDELNMKTDLNSSYHYGAGYYEGIHKGVTKPSILYGGNKSIILSIGIDTFRFLFLPIFVTHLIRKKGFLVACYMTLWMFTFGLGYYLQSTLNFLEVER